MTILNKTCKICGESKPTTEFPKNKNTKDKLLNHCKPCHLIQCKRCKLKRVYGLSEEAYEAMWVEAASKCAICATALIRCDQYSHAVDHNHDTGEVRGLLCQTCNQGLGFFKDNPTFLESAAAYLKVRGHYGERA